MNLIFCMLVDMHEINILTQWFKMGVAMHLTDQTAGFFIFYGNIFADIAKIDKI